MFEASDFLKISFFDQNSQLSQRALTAESMATLKRNCRLNVFRIDLIGVADGAVVLLIFFTILTRLDQLLSYLH